MERRQDPRRSVPYTRSAVLEAGGRNHIVTVTDLSITGAFLATRVALSLDPPLRLRVILPGASRESVMACQFVRWGASQGEATGPRRFGLAVRFEQPGPDDLRLLREFLAHAPARPAAASEPAPENAPPLPPADRPEPMEPHERFEYLEVHQDTLDTSELNRLGTEGWALAVAMPGPAGIRLVLRRRA